MCWVPEVNKKEKENKLSQEPALSLLGHCEHVVASWFTPSASLPNFGDFALSDQKPKLTLS